jgi:ATP phosphoribosyltransferase
MNGMKKILLALILFCSCIFSEKITAQSFDVQQLTLDYQKLTELKDILQDMYKGYQILETGYENIRSIAEGNFNLHKGFLDALLAINPSVKYYQRVTDIINFQTTIISEYKTAFSRFKQDKNFNPDEIAYLGNVYNNLISASANNIMNLTNVLTGNSMRMSDDERLHQIDGIYTNSQDQLIFLRQFNNSTTMLAMQRATDNNDVGTLQNIYGLK